MSDEKSKISLPTELISEKTFYTLGGASAGVLLVCWVINYVAVDVSWLSYKSYRFIGLLLSEAFAIIIMLKKKEKTSMKWLFAVLNGFLIFVNASGLNAMTAGYIFNQKDTSKTGAVTLFQKFNSNTVQQAGIFPLPRMINWWPDEKLIEQNEALAKANEALVEKNQKLQTIVNAASGDGETKLVLAAGVADSLNGLVKTLRSQLAAKQSQLDECINNTGAQSNNLNRQLAACINRRNSMADSLNACVTKYSTLNEKYEKIKSALENCNGEKSSLIKRLADCNDQKTALNQTINSLNEQIKSLSGRSNSLTLTEHIKQACNSGIIRRSPQSAKTADDNLKEQGFWKTFCASFNSWTTVIK